MKFGEVGEAPSVAVIVLAAGSSERMGDINKLTVPVDGVPMVARVVDEMLSSRANQVIVVTGHDTEAVAEALGDRDVTLVHNPNHAGGMGTSVAAGFAALPDDVDGALVALGDMPWVDRHVVDRLVDALSREVESSIYVPTFGRKPGNPVLFGSRYFSELRLLDGDVGGKALLDRYSDAILYVDVPSAAIHMDVDTPDALDDLARNGPKPR